MNMDMCLSINLGCASIYHLISFLSTPEGLIQVLQGDIALAESRKGPLISGGGGEGKSLGYGGEREGSPVNLLSGRQELIW